MINYSYEEFYKKIIEAKQKNKPLLFKNFIDDSYVPEWKDLLFCIYEEPKQKTIVPKTSELVPECERWSIGAPIQIGNVDIYQNLFLSFNKEEVSRNIVYFKKLFDIFQTIRDKTKMDISIIGPKIFIGPAQNKSHQDNWDAFSLQCEGSTLWTLSDSKYDMYQQIKPKYIEKFEVSRGDFLFFPKGMWHQVDSFEPRANIQFNAELNNIVK